MKGLDDQRKDQIIAGAVLVSELFKRLNLDRITVCKSALREGMIAEYLSRHVPEMSDPPGRARPAAAVVLDLARRCDWNQKHSEQVARLTMDLFDQLKPLHQPGAAGPGGDRVRRPAARHRLAHRQGRPPQAQHVPDPARRAEGVHARSRWRSWPTSPATTAGRCPRAKHEDYDALPKRAKQVARVGSALLRVADGLDRSHSGVTTGLTCTIGKRAVDVTIKHRGDAELELWGARQKADLFADVFDRDVTFATGGR